MTPVLPSFQSLRPWVAVAAATLSVSAPSQDLAVTPHVLSSGGGLSSSPRFGVHGSIGQPVASNDLHPDDTFDYRAGFWAVVLRWINSAPNPTDDLVARRPGESAHVLISQLLRNDRDPDYDALTFAGFEPTSAQGGAIFRDGPWLIYQPPAGAPPSAEDSFSYRITDGTASPVTGTVRLGPFIPSLAGPPNALGIALDPGPPAVVRLRFQGIARRTYLVQAATDPSGPWITLDSVAAAANGRVDFADTSPVGPRFYRLAEP